MKRVLTSIVFSLLICTACAAAPNMKVPGADAIQIRDFFTSAVTANDLQQPVKFNIAKGSLPFGLRLHADGRIDGYPGAVMRTTATIEATGANGTSVSDEIIFNVIDSTFRLVYQELPVVKLGETATIKIEGQGGTAPYSGCKLEKVRTFFDGAAKPGSKAPAEDAAPKWMTLSSDCKLTASKPDKETDVLMVISARDAAGATASEFFALRSAKDPAAPGWLELKAREYNADYQKRFSPNGLTLEINPQGVYHAYGDSAIWSGTYLGGAAYYYAVTGEQSAYQNMKKALDALTKLREITGVPGLIGRAFEGTENTGRGFDPDIKDAPENHKYLLKEGPYKDWRFLSTASRDQFTGVFWGNAIVWELNDDPALREQASTNIVSMASHIWDNKMHIMDADGKHTRHGVMSGYGIQDSDGVKSYDPYGSPPMQVPNGFNGALILNWFDMAATVAGDEATRKLWRDRYLALISKKQNPEPGRSFENNYLAHLKEIYVFGEKYNTYWETVWFNLNLLHNNYFHLTRFEQNPRTRDYYRGILNWLWKDKQQMKDGCEAPEKRRVERERNPYFTWQYLAAQGDRNPDYIFNAVSELMAFPRGPRAPFRVVDPIEIKAVPDHPDWACEPIPIQYRTTEDFMWQRDPYSIKKPWPEHDAGRNFAGVDVITPYWMGRYFGFIPSYL